MKPHELVAALVRDESKRTGRSVLAIASAMDKPSFQGTLHKFINGLVPSPSRTTAEKIADHYNMPVDAIYDAAAAQRFAQAVGIAAGLPTDLQASRVGSKVARDTLTQAHQVSQAYATVTPTAMSWSEVMQKAKMEQLPESFSLIAKDDSMAPLLQKGHVAHFSCAEDPEPGKPVLVADQADNLYIRNYVEGRAGLWHAVALQKDSFQTLESDRDGLRVVAVMVGLHWKLPAAKKA